MELHFKDLSSHEEFKNFIQRSKNENKKLYLEIGYGSGIVLRKRVENELSVLHMGLEIKGKFVKKMKQFSTKYNINNLYVEKADAKYMIPRFTQENTFDKIFIYYPDPWWKKKHKKYILFDYYFIADLYRALKKDGTLNIQTDVVEYFELIKSKFEKFKEFKECEFDDTVALDYSSTFEIKGINQGHKLSKIAYKK